MSSNFSIRQAVGMAVGAAGAAAATVGYAPLALGAATTGPSPEAAPEPALQEVVVTGSRIRRVDAETANPIVIIDQKAIQESGLTTVGDLLARIPSVSGSPTTPNVNNGGGYGESSVELRGLDARRTLVLVDGRRIGLVGTTSDATDVNQIPINLIDHIEVLKEGAGAIYGSDAIGGVVNFITRKHVDGLEIGGDYGRTSHKDGAHKSMNVLFGTSTDKFDIQVGGSYFQQDVLFGDRRDFSNYALYLYGGTTGVTRAGSSRVPTGRIYANPLGLKDAKGNTCASVTRIAGATGSSLNDYRCFNSPGDLFNFQPLNLITTPVERISYFGKANYKINDDVEAYGTVTHTHTHSGYHAAPLPFDSLSDGIVLSKNSIYNPFGIDFGGTSGANPDFTLRTFLFSARLSDTTSDGDDFNGGVKGNIGNTGWTWDANITYSRLQQHGVFSGYYSGILLQQAVGPSFIAADGTPTCGTPAAPISGCTPVNLFNQFANSPGALNGIADNYNVENLSTYKAAALDFTGKIISLPAGDLQAAVGFEYNDRAGKFTADSAVTASAPLYISCGLSQEVCTGPSDGKYNSKQEYLELYIPILKDLPLVHSLSADVGVRHNDYSLFGASTKSDFKVEYRPIKDLLLRGTFSQVLRVPTINDLYAAPTISSDNFNDPCTGLTQAKVDATPNLALACQGVPRDGSFSEPNGQVTGSFISNAKLKPETGTVKTAGFVYEPSYLSGFSASLDYWKYRIDGLIQRLDENYTIKQCIANGSPTFCNLAIRYDATAGSNAGLIKVFQDPYLNLGVLETSGADIGLKYLLKDTPIGAFQFSIDWTHTNNYDSTPPGGETQRIAGTFDKQFGNYAKNRAMLNIGWAWKGVDALITGRYIGSLVVHDPSRTGLDPNGNPYAPGTEPDLKISSVFYTDITIGYTFPTNTKLQFGVHNLSDKQPPIFYQNNVNNVNTDVNTYDVIGRQLFLGFNQKL